MLTREEKVCIECGTKVGGEVQSAAGFIATITSTLFYLSLLMMFLSLFVDRLPSFMFCMIITFALLFAMRTAKDSTQKLRKK